MSGWKEPQEKVWGARGLLFGKHSQGWSSGAAQERCPPHTHTFRAAPLPQQAADRDPPQAPKASGLFWMMMRVGRTREPASVRFKVKLLRKKSSYLRIRRSVAGEGEGRSRTDRPERGQVPAWPLPP